MTDPRSFDGLGLSAISDQLFLSLAKAALSHGRHREFEDMRVVISELRDLPAYVSGAHAGSGVPPCHMTGRATFRHAQPTGRLYLDIYLRSSLSGQDDAISYRHPSQHDAVADMAITAVLAKAVRRHLREHAEEE